MNDCLFVMLQGVSVVHSVEYTAGTAQGADFNPQSPSEQLLELLNVGFTRDLIS